ncbi:MAG TPA: hypothetical protein PKY59_08120 [Pyrinomonadaceae bacterium]|nr:hypothetical protein [Pyrinomonadaceae bacterium]
MINRLTLDISDSEKTNFISKASDLDVVAEPWKMQIEKEELKAMPKIADGRLPFVEKCADFSDTNPEFLPPFADVPEFKKDLKTYKDLREIRRPVAQMLDNIDNTMKVAGSEAWYAALSFYKSVQYHAKMGVPGAQTILDELRPLFEAKNKSDNETPNP